MLEDGGRLLRELISSCDGRACYPIYIFSVKEIKEAIDKYAYAGDYFFSYHGTLEGRKIFIKIDSRREDAFNEIVIVTQISHRNVVKLLGCRFEMEFPILVYEAVPNNLSNHIYEDNPSGPISWKNRLRIATEIAEAITYLHIGTFRPIVHRDIRSSHILLDENYRPKLCGFALSITIPLGQTHVEADVAGTLGYLDPDCRATGTVSPKSDVYSFGMLFFELLCGKKSIELVTMGEDNEFMLCFASEKILEVILDNGLSMDVKQVEQSVACIELVGRCMAPKPDQRPSMKEVTQQLRQIELKS